MGMDVRILKCDTQLTHLNTWERSCTRRSGAEV